MSPGARKVMLTAHVAVSVGWLGVALTMVALSLRGLVVDDPGVRVSTYAIMHFFDLALNAPLAVAMLVTGLTSALFTKWGLVRHTWVLVKLAVSLAVFVTVPVLSAPRLITLTETILVGAEPPGTALAVTIIAMCTATTLTAVTAISVIKPWGRTRWYSGQRVAAI